MAHAMSLCPDDVSRWIELTRLLEATALTEETALARSKAESLLKERLSNNPDDDSAAAALADLMPDPDKSPGWSVLQPTAMTSAAGATLSLLPDGSVLAAAASLESRDLHRRRRNRFFPLSPRSGSRSIPDRRLPRRGPGRGFDSGTFHLTAVRLKTSPQKSQGITVQLALARRNDANLDHPLEAAKSADPSIMWSIPYPGERYQAVFQLDAPLEIAHGQKLRVELDSGTARSPHTTIGRFRLSITNRLFPLFTPSLERMKDDFARHGLSRLGAAYCLQGDWTRAAEVLNRAASLPRASAADVFLLALARHHLGRHASARIDCDRAFEHLKTGIPDEETRGVAIEALMAVRNASVFGAESLLLDATFPADPFSR